MGTHEIENTWKSIDPVTNLKSPEELNQLLASKTRQTVNKFLCILAIDIIVSLGLISFLVITAINRPGDNLFLANNTLLCLATLASLVVSITSWYKLNNDKFNLPVRDWLEQKIKLLSGWLLGRYSKGYFIIIPVLLVMIEVSIHVYYENKPFTEVMKSEESVTGLIVGFIVALAVSYYAIGKIRKYQLKNLDFLKELYAGIGEDGSV
jgi:hypothetical protein